MNRKFYQNSKHILLFWFFNVSVSTFDEISVDSSVIIIHCTDTDMALIVIVLLSKNLQWQVRHRPQAALLFVVFSWITQRTKAVKLCSLVFGQRNRGAALKLVGITPSSCFIYIIMKRIYKKNIFRQILANQFELANRFRVKNILQNEKNCFFNVQRRQEKPLQISR